MSAETVADVQCNTSRTLLLKQRPVFSIVIPTYNRGYCIQQAIESVLRQTERNWELIIVDDGSTDDTPAILARYADPRIQIWRFEENAGHAARMHEAWAAVTGDYFVFLGSDDYLASDSLFEETARRFAALPPGVWTITYAIQCVAKGTTDLSYPEEIVDLWQYMTHPRLLFVDNFHIYRRAFVDAFLRLYDEPYTFFTAFLEVYLKHGCRQAVVPMIGAVAGFYGDNVTKGKGGSKYEMWAEQTAVRQFRCFRNHEHLRKTEWFRGRLKSVIYWSLTGTTLTFGEKWRTAWVAFREYRADFGLDLGALVTFVAAALPFALARRARRVRDVVRRYRQ